MYRQGIYMCLLGCYASTIAMAHNVMCYTWRARAEEASHFMILACSMPCILRHYTLYVVIVVD